MHKSVKIVLAPITNDDRLPHEKAVWREYHPSHLHPLDWAEFARREVSVDYGNGAIEQVIGAQADWGKAKRWRFGWAPERRVG